MRSYSTCAFMGITLKISQLRGYCGVGFPSPSVLANLMPRSYCSLLGFSLFPLFLQTMEKSPCLPERIRLCGKRHILSISKIPTFSLYFSIRPNAMSATSSVSGRAVTREGSKEERGHSSWVLSLNHYGL